MDEEDGELRNPFPSPPSHYTKYTSHNLALLALYNQRLPDHPNPVQHQILSDQTDVPEWPLTQLEKPRIDWILEEPDAYYDVFGDRWFVCDATTCAISRSICSRSRTRFLRWLSSAEISSTPRTRASVRVTCCSPFFGVAKLAADRRPALLSILRSLLVTYSSLTSSVLVPPPTMSANEPPEWQGHVEWITVLGQNLMAAANDLRPVQVPLLLFLLGFCQC
jgi:mediator of RNA polymerase II transcription subunit 7